LTAPIIVTGEDGANKGAAAGGRVPSRAAGGDFVRGADCGRGVQRPTLVSKRAAGAGSSRGGRRRLSERREVDPAAVSS
jgi:hypothetical protein